MPEELPTWLTTAAIAVIGPAITFLLTRGLYRSNIQEKDANALSVMTQVAADLAKQVQSFTTEIPLWKQKISVEATRADVAEKDNKCAAIIHKEAKIIIEEIKHFSYIKEEGEPPSSVEIRFGKIKAAAQRIAECME
jgi:hypothetical protein